MLERGSLKREWRITCRPPPTGTESPDVIGYIWSNAWMWFGAGVIEGSISSVGNSFIRVYSGFRFVFCLPCSSVDWRFELSEPTIRLFWFWFWVSLVSDPDQSSTPPFTIPRLWYEPEHVPAAADSQSWCCWCVILWTTDGIQILSD